MQDFQARVPYNQRMSDAALMYPGPQFDLKPGNLKWRDFNHKGSNQHCKITNVIFDDDSRLMYRQYSPSEVDRVAKDVQLIAPNGIHLAIKVLQWRNISNQF